MNLQEKIAKAREEFAATKPTELEVEVGGEIALMTFRPVWGAEWANLIAQHPPRPGAAVDDRVGYNTDGVVADYPVDAITVDGSSIDEVTWRELVSVLTSPNRTNIASVLYGLNQLEPARKLAEAGKASKG